MDNHRHDHATYPPLNTLKPVATDVWIVDGPVIRFGLPFLKFSFSTRMTIIRLPGDELFIHSPTPLTDGLRAEIAAIGQPRWLIGPNRIHYWWLPEWHRAFPESDVFLAPRVQEQAGDHIDFPTRILEKSRGYPWDDLIRTYPVKGRFMTEVVFFHIPSRTLILVDLIENFEPEKIGSRFMRWLASLGGVLDPDGQMPRDMRLTYKAHRSAFRMAIKTFIAWDPVRIIIAHGRWYTVDGTKELRRAFGWILKA